MRSTIKTLLIASCVLLALPTRVLAQSYSGGSGTVADPYQIANKTDLKYLSENSGEWSKHFKQTADIAFTYADFESGGDFYNSGEGWIPIGTGFESFTGSYDGDGHTIDSLYINRSASGIGMFSDVSSSVVPSITNLGLLNVTINSSGSAVGALAGNIFSPSSITYCYSTGTITVSEDYVGGLVGNLSGGTINNSYSECNVSSGESSVDIGGLVGYSGGSNSVVTNSYATGAVGGSGSGFVGGLIGVTFGYVYNSYSTGAVTGSSASGFVYQMSSLNAAGNFWDTQTSGSGFGSGATGKTTDEMTAESTFVNAGWDTTNVWNVTNGSYPTLKAPTIYAMTLSPEDGGSLTTPGTNLVITFSRQVSAQPGKNITIYNAAAVIEQIPANDGRVTVSGALVTINPDSMLPNGNLYVLVDAGSFKDNDSVAYGGITDTTAWNFTVSDPAPTIQTLSPTDGDTAWSAYADFIVTFSEAVTAQPNTYVSIYNSADELIEQIAADDQKITISGTQIVIDPDSVLPYDNYYVLIDVGAFRDGYDRVFDGIADNTTWNFAVSEPDLSAWDFAVELGSASGQYGKGEGVVTTQTDNVTLEAWVKWDGTNTGSPQIIVSNGYANGGGYGLYLYADTKFAILVNALAWHVSDSLLAVGEWTHVAAVRDNGTWSLYRNGDSISIGNPNTAPNTPSGNVFVGGDSLSYRFYGEIDEVRISTTARYIDPFTPPFGPFSADENTAVLYHFSTGGGSDESDASANGNDLSLYGNPSWVFNDYAEGPLAVTTDAASGITNDGGTLNATVETHGVEAYTRFLFGTTSGVYTDSVDAVPDTVDADATTQVSASISGYVSGQVIYYTAAAWNDRGEYVRGTEQSFTTTSSVWKNTVDFGESASQYAKAGGIVTSITDNLTLEAWVKWDGTNTAVSQVIASNGQAGGGGYGIYLYPNTKIGLLLNAVTWYVSDSTLSTDVWTHLAVVRDEGAWSIYKDGHTLSIGVATTNPSAPSPNFFVGGDSVSNYFHGDIDEVRMSDVVRYSEPFDPEIGPFEADGNTIALYRFNEGSGTTVGDSSGAGNDLTLFNSPTWKTSDNAIEPARAATYAATDVGLTSAMLHGAANGYGETSDARFVYGTESGVYTDSVDADPATVSGIYGSSIERYMTGLTSGTTYYFASAISGSSEYARGDEQSFWTTSEVWWYALTVGGAGSAYAKSNDVSTTKTDSVTLEAWVKWDGTNSGSTQLIVSNGYSGSDGYGLYLYSDTKLAILISAKEWLQSDSLLTAGVWTHVALVRSSSTWALYKDGQPVTLSGATTTNPYTPSTNLFIGGDSVGNKFQGEIDEVRVSEVRRYSSTFSTDFGPFTADTNTAALYHLDESNTYDASGNGRTLTLVNSPSTSRSNNRHLPGAPPAVSDSVAGSALDFTGETAGHPSHYIEIPYAAALNPADNFTAELWVKAEGGAGTYRSPLGCEQSTSPPQGFYFYAADNNRWQAWFGDSSINNYSIVNSDDSVIIDTWTHLAMTYSSGTAKLYVNGILKVTQASIGFNPNRVGVTRIGDIAESPGYVPFNGKVDEVRIWSVVRTAQQIREGMHRTIASDAWGLVAYYQLNEGSGTTVDDVLGSYPGTITGSPAWVTSTVPVGGGSSGTATSVTTGTMNFGTFLLSITDDFDEAVDLVGTQILAAPDVTTGISGTPLNDRYWVINGFGNPGTFVADLTFTVPTSFTNGGIADAAEYTLYHRGGNGEGTWTPIRSGATSLTTTTVSFDSISSFSQFTIGTADPLPVQMTGLMAEVEDGSVRLQWSTVTEVDNAGWEIERASKQYAVGSKEETVGWETIGFVEGAGTSTSPREYFSSDTPPIHTPQSTLLYRLRQIDRSGSFSYSEVVEVSLANMAPRVFHLSQNYPNPFNPTTTISYTLEVDGPVTLKVYDLIGREVAALVNEEQKAGVFHQITFDASRLASGVYFSRLSSGGKHMLRRLVLVK